jgi:phage gp36-like protein
MAYSTSSDVSGDFKNLTFASGTGFITSEDVDAFILEADALINSYVGQKYSVPVTASASALALLKLFSRTLVADRIKKILEVKQVQNTSANQEVRGAFSTKDVLSQLEKIAKGQISLDGATPLVSGGPFFSNNASECVEPTFHKDCKEW